MAERGGEIPLGEDGESSLVGGSDIGPVDEL